MYSPKICYVSRELRFLLVNNGEEFEESVLTLQIGLTEEYIFKRKTGELGREIQCV